MKVIKKELTFFRKVSRAAMGSLDKKGKDACWSQLATADGGEEGIETKGSTNATCNFFGVDT
jgi:hypothetical protein